MELLHSRDHVVGSEKRAVGVPAEQGATIVDALIANGRRRPDRPAMRRCPGERPTPGEWDVTTWAEYLLAARQVGGGLASSAWTPVSGWRSCRPTGSSGT